eukprot:gene16520-22747_t
MDTQQLLGAAALGQASMPMATFQNTSTASMVLCCLCGTSIPSNPSNMCVNCIRSKIDITEGISKQLTILWCKECGRYLQPPKHWVTAEHESKELLTFCIKKIRGLAKLIDAGFIWTEPHSMRLKVKLTVQNEVLNGAILQQSFIVDYTVRQHVFHKRTFLFLEQLILKHGADVNCVKIKDIHEGVDFYFQQRGHALKLIDFLQNVIPARFRHDKQLVSHDTHNMTYNYKYTFSVEIVPLCKDDLVCLPAKVSTSLGHMGPMVLVTKMSNQITLLDPVSLRHTTMDATVYWRNSFIAAASYKQVVEYVILDIELLGHELGKYALAEVQVARLSDFGKNDQIFFAKTHLGHILHVGDYALGYDLSAAQLTGLDYDAFIAKGGETQDVVLVRKSYEERRIRRRAKGGAAAEIRPWKLKSLNMEVDDGLPEEKVGRSRAARTQGAAEAPELERERFLQELEEDPELRARVNLFRDAENIERLAQIAAKAAAKPAGLEDDMDDSDSDDDDLPEVPLEELLDDLAELMMNEREEAEGVDEVADGLKDVDMDDA